MTLRATVAELRARGLVPEPLAATPGVRCAACGFLYDNHGPWCVGTGDFRGPTWPGTTLAAHAASPPSAAPEPLAHVSPDAEAARQMAARLQRALDEERRRGHALAEAVRGALVQQAVTIIHDDLRAALEEYDEPAREGAA